MHPAAETAAAAPDVKSPMEFEICKDATPPAAVELKIQPTPSPPQEVNSPIHPELLSLTTEALVAPMRNGSAAKSLPTVLPTGIERYRVLVIDDDPDISRALAMRLKPYGIEVLQALSGLQGYWTALDAHPDLVITDMSMPDGEGNYIVGRFKSHPLTKDIPVIVVTGQDNAGVKRLMLGLGVDAYLRKPIAIEELLQQMRRHLDLPHLEHRSPTTNSLAPATVA